MTKLIIQIPCLNEAATLPATLAGVRAQTFTDWRLVLVDDGGDPAEVDAVLAPAHSRREPEVTMRRLAAALLGRKRKTRGARADRGSRTQTTLTAPARMRSPTRKGPRGAPFFVRLIYSAPVAKLKVLAPVVVPDTQFTVTAYVVLGTTDTV